jgi:hypothetical protein
LRTPSCQLSGICILILCSTQEREANEKLQDVYQKLLQAGADQRESEREAKLKETLANLQRIFPGVRGRLVNLCQPTARKYEMAVSTVLGRNIDAVVVDEERTAIDCIDVSASTETGMPNSSTHTPDSICAINVLVKLPLSLSTLSRQSQSTTSFARSPRAPDSPSTSSSSTLRSSVRSTMRVARPLSAIPWRSLGMCAMNEARRSKVSSSVLLADHAADEIRSRNFGWDSHPQERFDHRWT